MIGDINVIDRLKRSWDKAESLNCIAEIRVDDPVGNLTFYIIGIDPVDEDRLMCIIDSPLTLEVTTVSARDIFALYDSEGNYITVNPTWQPIPAVTLYNKLRLKHGC